MNSYLRRGSFVPPILGLAVLMLAAAPAFAQSEQTAPLTTLDIAQVPTPIPAALPKQIHPPSFWATSSGFEGDTHGTGYGFVGPTFHKPLSTNLMLTAGAAVHYLYYGFASENGGRTNVASPGASAKAGVRLGNRNWVELSAGPAFKRQRRQIHDASDLLVSSDTRTKVGLDAGADLWVNPSKRNNIQGMLNYGTVDRYTWGRIGFKQQVTNMNWQGRFTHYLGTEYIGQGNRDIRSNQVGGFVEFLHVPSSISVMLRAGYKQSMFTFGPDKTGPWYAVSFYRAFK